MTDLLPDSFAAALAVAALAGLVSCLSPCVFPLLPGYVAFVSAGAAGPRQVAGRSLAFVVGFSIAFALLGAGVATTAARLPFDAWVLNAAAAFVVGLMGLALIWGRGMLPQLQVQKRLGTPRSFLGAAGVGAAFSIAWTPCIGPVLGAVLVYAASTEHASLGSLLLLSYSVGLGIPLVAVGLGAGAALRRSGIARRLRTLQIISGALLVCSALLIASGTMSRLAVWLTRLVS